ncbi:MAG TPA: hypothetical protein VII60_03990 [Acidimicrobiales bacterium]
MSNNIENAAEPANGAESPAGSELNGEQASDVATWFDNIPRGLKLGIAFVAIAVIAVVFATWHDFYIHWFQVHTGTINESGPYYGFWSGFGSDIGEATIVVGLVTVYRHHNCHVKGCARLGRRVDGTPYVACPKHHPDHQGGKRSISFEELKAAHKRAHKAQQ